MPQPEAVNDGIDSEVRLGLGVAATNSEAWTRARALALCQSDMASLPLAPTVQVPRLGLGVGLQ